MFVLQFSGHILLPEALPPMALQLESGLICENDIIKFLYLSDEFVQWFKVTHNLKRWAPKQFKNWLIKVLEGDTTKS